MDLTLVVPTFNRPVGLRRLLNFLRQSGYEGQVLVLDSGDERSTAANRDLVAGWEACRYMAYPAATKPFDKFAEGMARVETAYAMLCADDDIVFPSALKECIAFLDGHPDHVAAHGLYLNYLTQGQTVRVTGVACDAPSIDAPAAFERLQQLMGNYQALTYAVQRTPVAKKAFGIARAAHELLWQEVSGSAGTAIAGGVHRLPIVSHARLADSTIGYNKWHPVEWLSHDPAGFMAEYDAFLKQLKQALGTIEDGGTADRDIAHLGLLYLAPFMRREWIETLLSLPSDATNETRVQAAWQTWSRINTSPMAALFTGDGAASWLMRHLPGDLQDRLLRTFRTTAAMNGRELLSFTASRKTLRRLDKKDGPRMLNELARQFALYLDS